MTAYEKIVMLPPNTSKILYFPLQGSEQLVRTGTIGDGSCFGIDTRVYTQDGVKNIQDVVVGDKVITHTGNVNKVTHTFKNPLNNRCVYELQIYETPSITVTEDHRLYTVTRDNMNPEWRCVKELTKEHYVMIPKNNDNSASNYVINILEYSEHDNECYTYEYVLNNGRVDITTRCKSEVSNRFTYTKYITEVFKEDYSCNQYWNVDFDFCELLGIWYGNGYINHRNINHSNFPQSIMFSLSKNNTDIINFISNTGTKVFGVESLIHTDKNKNLVTIEFKNALLAQVFKNLFNNNFNRKNLPNFIHTCSEGCKKAFLSGLISTDGYIDDCLNVTLSMSNLSLIEEIYHLTRSIGIMSYVTYRDNNGGKLTGYMSINRYQLDRDRVKKYYEDDRLTRFKSGNQDYSKTYYCIVNNDNTFLQVQNKSVIEYKNEYVYTLEVENDHSYAVEGIIAENCIFHALLHAYSSDYVNMKDDKKMELVSKLRSSMARKVDRDAWKKMNNGMISMVSFQENVDKIISNFYYVIEKNKSKSKIKSVSLKAVVDHILVDDNTRTVYKSLFHIIPLKNVTGGGGILETSYRDCDDIDTCKDVVIKNSERILSKKLEKGGLDYERISYFVERFKIMMKCILTEAENSSYTKYVQNLENSESYIDQYQIGLISEKFNFDIYFINGKNRLPYLTGSDRSTYKRRKSVILLWVGENHYEIVGRVIKGTKRVQRQFEPDDPLIEMLYTMHCKPKKFAMKYPQFTQYLPTEFRKDFGIESSSKMSDDDSVTDNSEDKSFYDEDDDNQSDSDVYTD